MMSARPTISEAEAIKELHALRSQLPAIEAQMAAAAVEQVATLEAKQATLDSLRTKQAQAEAELLQLKAQPATTKITVATKRQARILALREVVAAYEPEIQIATQAVAAAQRAVYLARGKVGTETIRRIGEVENGVAFWRLSEIERLKQELARLQNPPLAIESELKRLNGLLNELSRGGQLPVARVAAPVAPQPTMSTTAPPPPAKPATKPSAPPQRGARVPLDTFLRDLGLTVDPANGKLTVSVVGTA